MKNYSDMYEIISYRQDMTKYQWVGILLFVTKVIGNDILIHSQVKF